MKQRARERNSPPSKGRIGKLILNTLGKKAKGGIQESLTNPKIPLPLKAEGFLPLPYPGDKKRDGELRDQEPARTPPFGDLKGSTEN